MRTGFAGAPVTMAAAMAVLAFAPSPAAGQASKPPDIPKNSGHGSSGPRARFKRPPRPKGGPVARLPDGKPDIEGYWKSPGSPAWDLEDHTGVYGIPPGKGVVIDPADGKIPYQPWAAERKKELFAHHMLSDPEAHCFLPGVPRQVYAPFGFQILQPKDGVVFLYEYVHSYRIVPTNGQPHIASNIRQFMGDSRGHWEGDTLVVDVTNQNSKTWFDMAGNFHSDQLHVIERYHPSDSNTIHYEATIKDPKVFTKPWKIGFDIVRNLQPNFEQLEFACHEGEQDLKHYAGTEGAKK